MQPTLQTIFEQTTLTTHNEIEKRLNRETTADTESQSYNVRTRNRTRTLVLRPQLLHSATNANTTKSCNYKNFIHTRPTEHNGIGGPIVTIEWLDLMETCFVTCECNTSKKVRFATPMFRSAPCISES